MAVCWGWSRWQLNISELHAADNHTAAALICLGLPRSKEVMLEVANRSLSREEGGASGLITSESTCGHKSICKKKEIGLF